MDTETLRSGNLESERAREFEQQVLQMILMD
jgi:hypothetical protein